MSCSEIFSYILKDVLCNLGRHKLEENMLSKISTALQAAADVVAPPCATLEDLKYHWQQVLGECQKCQKMDDGKLLRVAEETHAPRHLQEMLMIFADDSESSSISTTLTPCIEYVLQERILISLSSFAWADRPLGIRQYIFRFLSAILRHLHFSHLHQMRINQPLQAMVKATCEKRASPYEYQEMEFLSILCRKIKEDSTLILLYIEPFALMGDTSGTLTPELSGLSTPNHSTIETADEKIESNPSELVSTLQAGSKFPLIEALLNLCHSSDARTCKHAHDCLLVITSLREPRSSGAIASHTLLSHYIASRLITAAEMISLDTEPTLVEDIGLDANEGDASGSSEDEEGGSEFQEDFPGKKEVAEFLKWLAFCDKLLCDCDCFLATNMCGIVRELFLEGFVRAFLTMEDENDCDIADLYTALLTKMLLIMKSISFINCVISWLTEDTLIHQEGDGMRHLLLKRCSQEPHHLQIRSLRLLQVMLEKPGSLAVQVLALNYVTLRTYYDSSTAEHQQTSWSDEEDERYKHRDESERAPGSIAYSRTIAPANINVIAKRFLNLVPEEIRSTSHDDFDSYKADALKQYREICRKVPYHAWPREAVSTDILSDCSSTASRESKPEADSNNSFEEGPLLGMLLHLLESLSDQDYDINLQVTSLVSSLALMPHPHLHEYLLNPTIPLNAGVRSIYTILSKVVSRIHPFIIERKDFKNYLKITRFQLLGTVEELDYERDENDNKFETLIVIEEFCKELSAIAYAKYTCEGNLC